VYGRPGTYEATVTVTDELGFRARAARTITCRGEVPEEYAVAAGLTALPAACYPGDRLRPCLAVRGGESPGIKLSLCWKAEFADGSGETGTEALPPLPSKPVVTIGRFKAGRLVRLGWRVCHAGHTVLEGEALFLRPPFSRLPARVDGEALVDEAGCRLVLLANPGRPDPIRFPVPSGRGARSFVLLDDCLAAGGLTCAAGIPAVAELVRARLPAGGGGEVVHVPLHVRDGPPSAYAPHLKFPRAAAAARGARADTVLVLSLALEDMLARLHPDEFERQAAALTDMLTLTGKHPLVWITPPPFPQSPVPVRPYARAIMRVAEARGIPVGDVFTAFMAADQPRLFDRVSMGPTEQGRALAAEVIARACRQISGDDDASD
jgi:hypothetical protein